MRKISNIHNAKIGLLGGSFNPPHIGHLNISLRVLKKFNLSMIYWLVTPCSPHKSSSAYKSLEERVEQCIQITQGVSNKIKVLDIEKKQRRYFSSDTIKNIKKTHRNSQIYWIIGCDNLMQIHTWNKWKQIFDLSHIIVCERSIMSLKTHNFKASFNFEAKHVLSQRPIEGALKDFFIFHMKKYNISSTKLRNMV